MSCRRDQGTYPKEDMNPSIIGWSHIPFGRLDDSLEEMIIKVARGAIADAGISSTEVDASWLGHFNSGLVSWRGR